MEQNGRGSNQDLTPYWSLLLFPATYAIITVCPIPFVPARSRASGNYPSKERKRSRVLTIRLARVGARKQPYYRIVVIEKERARNGRALEIVGTYNPRTSPATVEMKRDRIEHWISKGAQVSDRVGKLLSKPAPASSEPAA